MGGALTINMKRYISVRLFSVSSYERKLLLFIVVVIGGGGGVDNL